MLWLVSSISTGTCVSPVSLETLLSSEPFVFSGSVRFGLGELDCPADGASKEMSGQLPDVSSSTVGYRVACVFAKLQRLAGDQAAAEVVPL